MTMTLSQFLTILAILIGPIISIQIQKFLDNRKENKRLKIDIFQTLMATRGTHASFEHVRALNMIDLVYYKDVQVISAWGRYLDNFCEECGKDSHAFEQWYARNDELFLELLYQMSESLGYKLDKVHLKKAIYKPKAYNEEEQYQYMLRQFVKQLIKGDEALNIRFSEKEKPNR